VLDIELNVDEQRRVFQGRVISESSHVHFSAIVTVSAAIRMALPPAPSDDAAVGTHRDAIRNQSQKVSRVTPCSLSIRPYGDLALAPIGGDLLAMHHDQRSAGRLRGLRFWTREYSANQSIEHALRTPH
jgi:hypothetical protein